jgi:hypothetical protein
MHRTHTKLKSSSTSLAVLAVSLVALAMTAAAFAIPQQALAHYGHHNHNNNHGMHHEVLERLFSSHELSNDFINDIFEWVIIKDYFITWSQLRQDKEFHLLR